MRLLSPEAEVTKSLSNLFKPWSVQTEVSNARVINSNELMAEYLEKNAVQRVVPQEQAEPTGESGEFSEGLFAGGNPTVIKAEPEVDYVAIAKEEAEQILADANAKAEELINHANAEVDKIRETAKNKGYEDGKEMLERELAELRTQMQESYRQKTEELEYDYCEKRKNMEHELVDVILSVFNKVFHIQFDNKKHILMYLIDDAIMNIEGEKRFRIKVAQSNVLFLENHKEEILDRVGHDIELEILADSMMDGNDCIIETDSGVFDCSLGTQLENLIKDIRSLCS
ncbi:MAG: FliH/SctL family protein [Clostridiales bacterium]|nr:flagellar biosynthesis protein [Roseburia sp.]MDD7637073.1 FliH/SctL family protein [Clostridiales bacterium]MDY4112417.1 FliH/SctL family protein [Roseburia sp.]